MSPHPHLFSENDWPNLIYMSEFQNMKRLDPYVAYSYSPIASMRSPQLPEPSPRMVSIPTTQPARIRPLTPPLRLQPRQPPHRKRSPPAQMVLRRPKAHAKVRPPPLARLPNLTLPSAFFGLPHSQLPPQRRITQDDAPSMMPHPTQNTSHQGGGQHNAMAGAQPPFGPSQSHSKPSSAASFASLSGSGPYGAGQGTSGHAHGPVRKKARMG